MSVEMYTIVSLLVLFFNLSLINRSRPQRFSLGLSI